MSLRWRIALAMATISLVATALFGAVSYQSTRSRLIVEIDRSLGERGAGAPLERLANRGDLPARGPLSELAAQVVLQNGTIAQSTFPEPIPPTQEQWALIGKPRTDNFSTVATSEGEFRVRAIGSERSVVFVGRSLDETNRVLEALRARTMLLTLLVACASAAAGLLIATRVTKSLRKLTIAAEEVESSGRLDAMARASFDETGRVDEVGRLADAFDRMLAALARSKDDQQRLVQDASHELRTPLTSLRTNIDSLVRFPTMDNNDRDAILRDLQTETSELADLVGEIVAVASGEIENEAIETFDLTELANDMAVRYVRRTSRQVLVIGEPCEVSGQRAAIQRALSCLLDNARKFDSTTAPIEISVRDGSIAVADRGGGIPQHELERVFDRFHRSDDTRTMPGSGLGLAIVRDVALRHGGDTFAKNREGGGAVVGFSLLKQ